MQIQITNYNPSYQSTFRALNKEWIDKYFVMEPADYAILDHPQEYIIDKGGYIVIALEQNQPVGVCALVNRSKDKIIFELAKMAVSTANQGQGIGSIMAKAVIAKAKSLHAHSIYLESNTILKPAIHLYKKLGFVEVKGFNSPYKRSNIKMEIVF